MEKFLLLISALVPVVILLFYIEKKDIGPKEPRSLKWKVFLYGILITFVAIAIEGVLDGFIEGLNASPIISIFLKAFIVAALVEEGCKFYVVKKVTYNHRNFDEVMDGIYYAVIASLGLAVFENVMYVFSGGFSIALMRALLSVPAHAFFSGIMGFYIGMAKKAPSKALEKKNLFKGLFFAIFYHGSFNFLLMFSSLGEASVGGFLSFIAVVPLMVIMYLHLSSKIKLAHFEDKVSHEKPTPIGFWRVLRVFSGSIFLLVGALFFIGIIISEDLSILDNIPTILFNGVIFIFPGVYLVKKK